MTRAERREEWRTRVAAFRASGQHVGLVCGPGDQTPSVTVLAPTAGARGDACRDAIVDLYSPETRASLAAWLAETPFDTPFRHYRVVTDKAGNLLAGLALTENCRLRTTVVIRMPTSLRLLNTFLHIVPSTGVLRELAISGVWYAPGQLKAAQYLFETVRWEWRDQGTSLVVYADVRSPVMDVYGVRPWKMKTTASIALRGPTPLSDEKLIYSS